MSYSLCLKTSNIISTSLWWKSVSAWVIRRSVVRGCRPLYGLPGQPGSWWGLKQRSRSPEGFTWPMHLTLLVRCIVQRHRLMLGQGSIMKPSSRGPTVCRRSHTGLVHCGKSSFDCCPHDPAIDKTDVHGHLWFGNNLKIVIFWSGHDSHWGCTELRSVINLLKTNFGPDVILM